MNLRRIVTFLFIVLLHAAPSKSGNVAYENPPGWKWLVEPMTINVETGYSINKILMISSVDYTGAFTLTVGWKPEEGTCYRAVVIDSIKQRHLPDSSTGPGTGDMTMTKYTWDKIGIENIASVRFEILTPDGWLIASKEAMKRAENLKIKVLPYPEIGKLYEFELDTYNGESIRSKELRGKVVVLDFWATWCTPCMNKIPDIQVLQKTYDADQLEVIGINYDSNTDLLQKALSQNNIEWPTVHVPPKPEVRDICFEACSISYLPRLFVLDQNGFLRLDTNDINQLKSMVAQLNGDSE